MYGENMRSPEDWRHYITTIEHKAGKAWNEVVIKKIQVDAWNAAIEVAAVELWEWAQKMQHNKQWDVERELLCDACEEIRALKKEPDEDA